MTSQDRGALAKIGRRMAASNGYRPIQASDLYITSGTTRDYAYGKYRIFSYTFELSTKDYPDDSRIASETGRNKEAVLYLFDWSRRQVVFQTVPVPGAEEIFSVEVGADGIVYGLTAGGQFFGFDPVRRVVVKREDLSALGEVVRHSLGRSPDGVVHGVLGRAVFRVEADGHRVNVLATPPVPITAGLAITGDRLYFAAKANIWSCRL